MGLTSLLKPGTSHLLQMLVLPAHHCHSLMTILLSNLRPSGYTHPSLTLSFHDPASKFIHLNIFSFIHLSSHTSSSHSTHPLPPPHPQSHPHTPSPSTSPSMLPPHTLSLHFTLNVTPTHNHLTPYTTGELYAVGAWQCAGKGYEGCDRNC